MHSDILTRSPLLAGIFYPGDGKQLFSEIAKFEIPSAPPDVRSCAIVAPHGSFSYSGRVAAIAWAALRGAHPAVIVIAGAAHLPYEEGVFLPESTQFEIPGATLSVDTALQKRLLGKISSLRQDDLPHLEEHSIEMQLPFAAYLFPGVPIMPLILSGWSTRTIATAVDLMKEIQLCHHENSVLVISSDLAVSDTPEECDALSNEFIAALKAKKHQMFHGVDTAKHSFCAESAIRSFLIANPQSRPELLEYRNSAAYREHLDEPVVGYGAIRFVR